MYRIHVIFPTGAAGCVNTNGDEYRVDTNEADPGSWTEAEFGTKDEVVNVLADCLFAFPDCEFSAVEVQ
jgi:hypothetical protein